MSDYGRSGQGWLSYMLCYILNAKYVEPNDFLTGTLYTTDDRVLALTGGDLEGRAKTKYSMIIKTHHLWPGKNFNLTDKVIFLTRHPCDIAVSAYYRYNVLAKENPPRSLKEVLFYLLHKLRPISYAFTAKRWKKFMHNWTSREDLSMYRVRYEDVSADPIKILNGLLDFLEEKADSAIVEEAVELFKFEKMSGRKKGDENSTSTSFRKGIVGDYKNKFSKIESWIFCKIAGQEMRKQGYSI